MRTLALAFALISAPAFASPGISPPAAGHYAYNDSFEVTMKLHYEVVYAFTPKGQERLAQLRKAGSECWNKGRQTYLCKSFQSTEGATAIVKSRVSRELGGKELVLGTLQGEPTLISQGEDVAEYRVPQTADYDGKSYASYRLVLSQGNWSVRLGDPVEIQFSWDHGKLGTQLTVPVTESKTEYSVYVVQAEFPPASR